MKDQKTLSFQTELTSQRTLTNGSISMNIKTPVLDKDGEMAKELYKLNNAVVEVAIVPVNNPEGELLEIPKTNKYSQSQNIRFELQNAWQREGEKGEFIDYYNKMTNNIIDWIKKIKK